MAAATRAPGLARPPCGTPPRALARAACRRASVPRAPRERRGRRAARPRRRRAAASPSCRCSRPWTRPTSVSARRARFASGAAQSWRVGFARWRWAGAPTCTAPGASRRKRGRRGRRTRRSAPRARASRGTSPTRTTRRTPARAPPARRRAWSGRFAPSCAPTRTTPASRRSRSRRGAGVGLALGLKSRRHRRRTPLPCSTGHAARVRVGGVLCWWACPACCWCE